MGNILSFKQFENYIGNKANLTTKAKRKLQTAQELVKRRANNDFILNNTKWFLGLDKKWRYEANTSQLEFRKIKYSDIDKFIFFSEQNHTFQIKLKDLITKTNLFKLYPQLKEMDVYLDIKKGEIPSGHFVGYTQEEISKYNSKRNIPIKLKSGITIFGVKSNYFDLKELQTLITNYDNHVQSIKDLPELGRNGKKIDKEELLWKAKFIHEENTIAFDKLKDELFSFIPKDVLIHEIQHAIQKIEEFPKGSSPSQFKPYVISSSNEREPLIEAEKQRLFKLHPDFKEMYDKFVEDGGGADSEFFNPYYDMQEQYGLSDFIFDVYSKYPDIEITPLEQYKRTAGEIEANDVGYRTKLTNLKQWIVYSQYDENFPLKNIIGQFDTEKEAQTFKDNNEKPYEHFLIVQTKETLKNRKPFHDLTYKPEQILYLYYEPI